jgi:hypothetical protein
MDCLVLIMNEKLKKFIQVKNKAADYFFTKGITEISILKAMGEYPLRGACLPVRQRRGLMHP